MTHRYHPFYCEENVWWLCHADSIASNADVLFISNERQQCLLLQQRAAPEGEPVLWDYHVVLVSNGSVWDLDSRLEMPTTIERYLNATFPPLPHDMQNLAPSFRVVAKQEFLSVFCTDRSHMQRDDGSWLKPPPSWQPPKPTGKHRAPNQLRFVDMRDDVAGTVLDLDALRLRYSR
jgi:hypothetical protein